MTVVGVFSEVFVRFHYDVSVWRYGSAKLRGQLLVVTCTANLFSKYPVLPPLCSQFCPCQDELQAYLQ